MLTTAGTLLGGRVRYRQPACGYRTGIEPVLLAASVPARPGARVLEAGTGAGAGLLCLAARVSGILGVGVEIDPAMAELARHNAAENGFAELDVVTAAIEGATAGGALAPFDHAMANPPWHDPRSTASPWPSRRQAKQAVATETTLAWIAALAGMLRAEGSLTLILPASQASGAASAMSAAGLGGAALTYLAAKAEKPAKLVLIQGWRGRQEPGRTATIVLHGEDGAFTPAIEAVLRAGSALAL